MRKVLPVLVVLISACAGDRRAEYSGTVETREIQAGSKVGGRVTEVLAEEGQTVKSGAPLIRFESEELKARREQLQARIIQAEAELARLERGFRPEEIRQAEAAARQQRALLEAAKKGPREQELQQAHAEYAAAKAEATYADLEFQRVSALHASGDLSTQRRDDAKARRDLTAARAEAARQRLALLQAGTREEELRAAEQRYRQAEAQAELTRRGSRAEDIDAARARVREARGALAELNTRLDESELRAPADARVEVISVRPGDLVVPNRTVVTLLEPAQLWVRVYVPETELGKVRVGQKATVKVDSFGGRTFAGTVEQISSQAEFLPRNVQTRDDREHQMFGVKVRVANPEDLLKSGMAATVTLE